MKKIIILIVVLLASFGLKGQDTIWKDGALYRVDTRYEKLIDVPDSTKISKAKRVFLSPKIPLYDTLYDVEIKSAREFFIMHRRMHITEKGIRITDKREYYEKLTVINQKEQFNVWLVTLILLGIVLLVAQQRYLNRRMITNRSTPFLSPIVILSVYVVSILIFRVFMEKTIGPLFVDAIVVCMMSLCLLLAVLFFVASRRLRKKE